MAGHPGARGGGRPEVAGHLAVQAEADDRKKREREATAINRACGREARHLHEKMIAEREAARPDWEVTVRIRDVQQSIRKEEADRRAREQEHGVPVYRSGAPEPSRAPGPTRDRGHGR